MEKFFGKNFWRNLRLRLKPKISLGSKPENQVSGAALRRSGSPYLIYLTHHISLSLPECLPVMQPYYTWQKRRKQYAEAWKVEHNLESITSHIVYPMGVGRR